VNENVTPQEKRSWQRVETLDRKLHAVRRTILERLVLRMSAMKFGFTFIEHGENGVVENATLKPFDSLEACCVAAERALQAARRPLARVDVVPCEYDGTWCHPDLTTVMKTFRPSGL